MRPGQAGFCRVRENRGGELVTLNYGVGVQMTEEVIETEAVNHFAPGARILSLGNIGCMYNCDFCHNWKTSQVRFVEKKDIHHYTPEEVVNTAIEKGIDVISWTYNDPVVWHEFVMDTSRIAKARGLTTLYKSAFGISYQGAEELREVIDIFSLSLKSLDADFYRKVVKGRIEPVLEAIKQVHSWGDKHLELSNLCVTGMNDNMTEVDRVIRWVLDELDENVPLHFVRFHPDYKYTKVERTNVEFLKKARERALQSGIKYCYLGNVYERTEGLNTFCPTCRALVVSRFGLETRIENLDADSKCTVCRTFIPIRRPFGLKRSVGGAKVPSDYASHRFEWHGDINATHYVLKNETGQDQIVFLGESDVSERRIKDGESWRGILSRSSTDESAGVISVPPGMSVEFKTLLDRAHFPT